VISWQHSTLPGRRVVVRVLLFDLAPGADGAWRAATPHQCRQDCYSAELLPQEWGLSLRWAIIGPKKQETIDYEYR